MVLVLVVGLAATACGDDASEDESTSGETPVALEGTVNEHGGRDLSGEGGSAELELELDDFYFAPTFVKAAPSQTIEVEAKNEGNATHTFTVDPLSIDQEVAPDTSRKISLKLPASGVVSFYCRFHRGQGMQGAVYFEEGDSGDQGSSPTTAGSGY